ncbi:MAG: sulfatase-like hydrolase/transferase, partial [Planctomycetes bacterium]|nr:sulfatase-like hydrolase/transferase [Planctomycetota bacterium]
MLGETMRSKKMSCRGFIKTAVIIVVLSLTHQWAMAQNPERKPNIIYIMADDLGYGDLGCYGNTDARTPHINKMAAGGMRLTDFHSNGPVCTPTRAALLTGKYQQRVGMYVAPKHEGYTQVKTMPLEELTFAELAKLAGYSTAIIGKWHLGDHLPYLATRQGFDEWFGVPYSNDMNPFHKKDLRPPLPLYRGEQIIEMHPDQDYLTSRYTKEAIDFIRRNKANPFLLYLPHSMPHKPVHCSEPFQKRFTKEQLDSIKDDYDFDSRQFLYPAAIEEIDHSTGEIIKILKEVGIEKDTLVIFSSDNGPQTAGSAGALRGKKGSM